MFQVIRRIQATSQLNFERVVTVKNIRSEQENQWKAGILTPFGSYITVVMKGSEQNVFGTLSASLPSTFRQPSVQVPHKNITKCKFSLLEAYCYRMCTQTYCFKQLQQINGYLCVNLKKTITAK